MFQSRTHTCNDLRMEHVGQNVTIVGWYENLRKVSKNLGFLVLRDFYGTTQVVIETEEMMDKLNGVNCESTLSITGMVRERSSKNPNQATGDIEVVPTDIVVLGKCRHNELPFEINRSKEADENARLKYRYLDLRNPAVKHRILQKLEEVLFRLLQIHLPELQMTFPCLTDRIHLVNGQHGHLHHGNMVRSGNIYQNQMS